ncbi:hypothetical protein M9H77_12744 [Catharanthus roseus]|uniref:Uncharacterized protein n=1 Tax=Catharanthus roseus TaxID=4058 RepID=A0ACC0BI68_CATRO|nr:hypothetical protein M9H77_12744 [Catharanthus roseus]
MEALTVEESPKIKEFSKAKIEEILKIHVVKESSKEEPSCIMSGKSIENKEKEIVENKESGQVESSCNEENLSNVINSLNTLFENTFGFRFHYFHFKEFLLKDFDNLMGISLELFKVNHLAFEKSNLRKVAFEQVCKDFVVGHLFYHRPFKECFLKLFM